MNATVPGCLVKANAMSQICHSFYNLLTDNPVSVWQEDRLTAAATSTHVKQVCLFFFSARLVTAFRAVKCPRNSKHWKIKLVGEGLTESAFRFYMIKKKKKKPASLPSLHVVKRCFFNPRWWCCSTLSQVYKLLKWDSRTVWNQSKPVNVMCLCMDINGETEPFYSHLSENGNIM